jgi:nucleoside-diphosphate-sugar epimerase
VVITSSFAAILDETKLEDPSTVFTEQSWNPVTLADIHRSPPTAYRASKALAEKLAWDFVGGEGKGGGEGGEKPRFDVVTVCPPLVVGPVAHYLASLDAINTSNGRVVECLQGKWKESGPPKSGPVVNWVDVRDVATAHVRAGLELPEAGGKRLWVTAGGVSNREVADIIRKHFPEYADRLPAADVKGGEMPPADRLYKFDNSATAKLLGIEWISYEKSVVDTVKSLKDFL